MKRLIVINLKHRIFNIKIYEIIYYILIPNQKNVIRNEIPK